MTKVRWGIIGPGTIAKNFADGLAEADNAILVAIASRSDERRQVFGDTYNISDDLRFTTYETMVQSPDVDAIYIATPHPFHAEHSILAMRAGKHVLCEKPAGLIAGETVALTEVAAQEGVFFMEAFMYRCHPQMARLKELLLGSEIGAVRHISARFGFAAPFSNESRAYSKSLAGGGILDVGCYPMSFARFVAGVADGQDFANPTDVSGVAEMAPTGVDQTAYATLKFASGITAEIACAVSLNMDNTATIIGTRGQIQLSDPWTPGRNAGPSDTSIDVTVDGKTTTEIIRHPAHLFMFEAAYASAAILEGHRQPQSPAVSWADSIGNAHALDEWRHSVGYKLAIEDRTAPRIQVGTLPDVPKMPMRSIEGVERPVSQLVMGCDNRNTVAEGALVWDAWMEAGGNAFDTGFVYGGGLHEEILGHWMTARGVNKEAVVIVKGAHSPYCTPRAIESQLSISLERLQLDKAPIYIMHRDNPDVPVGEFVDVLNQLQMDGKIGIFGGSNWTVERFEHANSFADRYRMSGFSVLNNNLSLAVMEKPVWPGCVTSNTPQTLAALRHQNTAHFSWSSQARGYFLPEDLRNRLPKDTSPETCFGGPENAERRQRAETLASERGVSAHNIATAWVLGQSFPSFALIGPRSAGEIASTMPGAALGLSANELAWLNLETDARA